MNRTVSPMKSSQIELMINYFLKADDDFLRGMGADPSKLPSVDEWRKAIEVDFARAVESKQLFYVVWYANAVPIGHSNINKIVFGQEAFVHLHIWSLEQRRSGNALLYFTESIRIFFEQFQLQRLYCEPYAYNPAPNKILPQVGFELIKTYDTTPGLINLHQTVNLWKLEREFFSSSLT